MAIDFSKFNFFSRLNAKARVGVILAIIVGLVGLVYLGTRYFIGGSSTTGPSRVANAPSGLQSVPGSQLTPEYYRTLVQANTQAAQQAQVSGSSAVPTLINIPGQGQASCIICSDESANVKTLLDNWSSQGKINPDVAAALQELADKNVTPETYAAELERLVREGKLTPEQARLLLEQYKKQHANALLNNSAKTMDDLIKSGQLPVEVANGLLDAQQRNISPAEYAAELQRLVREGKISPETAQRLLSQYAQQFAKQVTMKSIAILEQWGRAGEITPDVLKELIQMENDMVPYDRMGARLQQLLAQGKLTPAVADKILAEYKAQKDEIGSSSTMDELIRQAEAAAFQEISELLRDGKITPETGAQLTDMIQRNIPLEEYKATVAQMVQQNKLTPDIAQLKIGDYQKIKELRDQKERLLALQANNATPSDYADALRQAVAAGILTPEQAARLLQEYQALKTTSVPAPVASAGTGAFATLQQNVQQGATPALPTGINEAEFAAAQTQANQETQQDREARIQAIMGAMSGQATQLINSWQPPTMAHREGQAAKESTTTTTTTKTTTGSAEGADANGAAGLTGPVLIKAGTILFGVLDTAVNSDYPDTPVMVTIVNGDFKGAKLLGKLTTSKSVAGQLDRVSLTFSLMNMDDWPKSKGVTAFAIDPDTARTVLASQVNYHYLKRYGAIMATSFLQGYATAVTNGGTTSNFFGGTTQTGVNLSPGNRIAVALGQIGQNLGSVTQNYVNIPPTVKVDSGVGLGILFMSDIT